MGFMSSKSDTVQLTRLRHGLLACFAQCGVQKLEVYEQSHGFPYNLGIIPLTKGINCTRIHVITYTNNIDTVNTNKELYSSKQTGRAFNSLTSQTLSVPQC